jgi:enamine deaminase RidA (YjgF/YER057c/UK114 family)
LHDRAAKSLTFALLFKTHNPTENHPGALPMKIVRYQAGPRMSQMVVYGNFGFTAGQVADDPSQDVKGQTAQILAKLDRLLADAGSDKTKILSANIWLADYQSFAEMNEVWDAWVPKEEAPARACVESKLAFPQYTVEIGVIVAL